MDLSAESLFTVAGKTAIVTGGSSGVGRMIASVLAANGVQTWIVGRKRPALEAAAGEIGLRLCRRRSIETRRDRSPRGGDGGARAGDRHPRQQCRCNLGGAD